MNPTDPRYIRARITQRLQELMAGGRDPLGPNWGRVCRCEARRVETR